MKQTKISICFRVNGNEKIGLGHLSRCRSLMLAFKKSTKCKFAVISNSEATVRNFIAGVNFDYYGFGEAIKEEYFDIYIVDIPDIKNKEIIPARKKCGVIVCIDDDGADILSQDILIRPNLLNLPRSKSINVTADNYWSGRKYIILHPDFVDIANKRRKRTKRLKRLLVCFGGSDPKRLIFRVLPLLKKLDVDIKVIIVLGTAFSCANKVISKTKNDRHFLIKRNVKNMARLIWQSDIALISGGTMLYETCSLGIPAVVLSQNRAQAVEADICQKKGAVFSLGVANAVSDEQIMSSITALLNDDLLRIKMSHKGRKIISANGSKIIAERLLSYIKKR